MSLQRNLPARCHVLQAKVVMPLKRHNKSPHIMSTYTRYTSRTIYPPTLILTPHTSTHPPPLRSRPLSKILIHRCPPRLRQRYRPPPRLPHVQQRLESTKYEESLAWLAIILHPIFPGPKTHNIYKHSAKYGARYGTPIFRILLRPHDDVGIGFEQGADDAEDDDGEDGYDDAVLGVS